MPFIIGSTTPIIAFVAIAASTAFPPLSKILTPACEASGDSEATIPPREITIDRVCPRSWPLASRLISTNPPARTKSPKPRTRRKLRIVPPELLTNNAPHLTSPVKPKSPTTHAAPRILCRGTTCCAPACPGVMTKYFFLRNSSARSQAGAKTKNSPSNFLPGEFLCLLRQQLPPIIIISMLRRRKRHSSQHFARLGRPNCHEVPQPVVPIMISIADRQSRGLQQISNFH